MIGREVRSKGSVDIGGWQNIKTAVANLFQTSPFEEEDETLIQPEHRDDENIGVFSVEFE